VNQNQDTNCGKLRFGALIMAVKGQTAAPFNGEECATQGTRFKINGRKFRIDGTELKINDKA
jgi:hypothetical protein